MMTTGDHDARARITTAVTRCPVSRTPNRVIALGSAGHHQFVVGQVGNTTMARHVPTLHLELVDGVRLNPVVHEFAGPYVELVDVLVDGQVGEVFVAAAIA